MDQSATRVAQTAADNDISDTYTPRVQLFMLKIDGALLALSQTMIDHGCILF